MTIIIDKSIAEDVVEMSNLQLAAFSACIATHYHTLRHLQTDEEHLTKYHAVFLEEMLKNFPLSETAINFIFGGFCEGMKATPY